MLTRKQLAFPDYFYPESQPWLPSLPQRPPPQAPLSRAPPAPPAATPAAAERAQQPSDHCWPLYSPPHSPHPFSFGFGSLSSSWSLLFERQACFVVQADTGLPTLLILGHSHGHLATNMVSVQRLTLSIILQLSQHIHICRVHHQELGILGLERAQWLQALAALPDYRTWVPSTHIFCLIGSL